MLLTINLVLVLQLLFSERKTIAESKMRLDWILMKPYNEQKGSAAVSILQTSLSYHNSRARTGILIHNIKILK